jgi:hypothetical protein
MTSLHRREIRKVKVKWKCSQKKSWSKMMDKISGVIELHVTQLVIGQFPRKLERLRRENITETGYSSKTVSLKPS